MTLRIGIVGVGKIAQDQHVPAIAATSDFELIATAGPHGSVSGIPNYRTMEEMLAAENSLAAVSLCQPPQARFEAARAAIVAGKHVFLEKPPGATLGEVELLRGLANAHKVSLFSSWHSREAPGVAAARAWLSQRRVQAVRIEWKEDVRYWHPGQTWIWEPGGLGVFDPGINALSIISCILPMPIFVESACLSFPANRGSPIAAELSISDANGTPMSATFDWRHTGAPLWDIKVETDDGELLLSKGGAALHIDAKQEQILPESEYAGLYRRFAALIAERSIDVDLTPLRLVADAFLRGSRKIVERFED